MATADETRAAWCTAALAVPSLPGWPTVRGALASTDRANGGPRPPSLRLATAPPRIPIQSRLRAAAGVCVPTSTSMVDNDRPPAVAAGQPLAVPLPPA